MNKTDTLLLEYDKAKVLDIGQNAALERFNEAVREEAEATAERIKKAELGNGDFTVYELTYASSCRCACGVGMAYPENIGMHGAWYCSDILQGRADRNVEHTAPYPFMYYSIKSESQPSQNGLTTRPTGTHVETIPSYACNGCKHTGQGEPYRACQRENLKNIKCSNCGEKYINEDGSSNSKISVRFFHRVARDCEQTKENAQQVTKN